MPQVTFGENTAMPLTAGIGQAAVSMAPASQQAVQQVLAAQPPMLQPLHRQTPPPDEPRQLQPIIEQQPVQQAPIIAPPAVVKPQIAQAPPVATPTKPPQAAQPLAAVVDDDRQPGSWADRIKKASASAAKASPTPAAEPRQPEMTAAAPIHKPKLATEVAAPVHSQSIESHSTSEEDGAVAKAPATKQSSSGLDNVRSFFIKVSTNPTAAYLP